MSLLKLKKKIAEQKMEREQRANRRKNVANLDFKAITTSQTTKSKAEIIKPAIDGLPAGYSVLNKHDVDKLELLKQKLLTTGVCSYDYETDGDPDEPKDPQDHKLVGVSFSYEVGKAFYLPVGHTSYGANWDIDVLVKKLLKPVLEHPEVTVIAHNVKFEHQVNLMHGIDIFPKTKNRKVIDTMLLIKELIPEKCLVPRGDGFDVELGLKPATKNLLADENGMVHGIIHVDDIQSFKDTVGTVTLEVPTGEVYVSGKNKGKQKMKKLQKHRTFNQLPVDKKVIDYGCSDSDWALGIANLLLPVLKDEGLDTVYFDIDVPCALVRGEYELAGWHINREKLEKMGEESLLALKGDPEKGVLGIEAQLNEALLELTDADTDEDGNVIVPAGVYFMGEWRGNPVYLKIKTSKPFNWASVQHLQWLFFHVLNIPTAGISRSKKTGLPGTGKNDIAKIIENYDGESKFISLLKEKKKHDKFLGNYVNGFLPYCREDTSKIHTSLNLVSTWRFSSKEPNLQNITRPENDIAGMRGVFEAPYYDPEADYSHLNICTKPVSIITERKLSGHTFYISTDYSQIELKVLAWFAQEPLMMDILTHGGDLHSTIAKEVFKLPCEVHEVKKLFKTHRYRAKTVNFGLVYGMTEYGLSKDPRMEMTIEEAKEFIEMYFDRFPGIKEYTKEKIEFCRKYGYAETMFGHRRPIPEINSPSKWIRQSAENKAINSPIQGSASDIMQYAMVNLRKDTGLMKYCKNVMQIHDEIISEVPVEYAVQASNKIKAIMEQEIDGFSDVMPIIAEPALGRVWKHALDLKCDENGVYYVSPKIVRSDLSDVTISDIEQDLHLYELAGIEVRINDNRK